MLKNNRGFTLVEMLIVMLIITVLMLLIIPNIISQSDSVNEKGCTALVAVVQAQADAYYLETGSYATIEKLDESGHIDENQQTCNNVKLEIDDKGIVSWPNNSNED